MPGEPGEVVIPRVAVVKSAAGDCWVTSIDAGDGHADLGDLAPSGPPRPAADSYRIEQVTPTPTYLAAVAAARDAVRAGRLTKAVIAREIAVTATRPFDRHGILHRLKAAFGLSYRFAVDGFFGASPELLVAVDGRTVTSHPLAGTAPRAGDPDRDAALAAALIESTKNQVEHRVVIDMVHDTLLPWCSYLDWEPEPSIVTVANVQHLGTRIEGRLSSPPPHVATLVRALSPTPALGGHPGPEALKLIADVEGVERDRYGGAVGWLDATGNGTWAVAIRCAQLSDDRHDRPPARRRWHRRRQRPAGRVGRDPGQVPGDAVGDHPPLMASATAALMLSWIVTLMARSVATRVTAGPAMPSRSANSEDVATVVASSP